MKYLKISAVIFIAVFAIFLGCKRDLIGKQGTGATTTTTSKAVNTQKTALATPVISCAKSTAASITIQVCAGASGAPAGFSVQWMLKADYDAHGWSSDLATATSYCAASFSGVPKCSNYNLPADACTWVNIGENLFDDCGASSSCTGQLDCGKDYVFRVFAHNDPVSGAGKSAFSATLTCNTLPCTNLGCTYSQGLWKTHGPVGCNPSSSANLWPVTSMQLGTVVYSDLQLCSILNTPAAGNGLISLAHQLIAAKMNIANGADGSAITLSIAAADALIGGLVIPPVGSGSLAPAATSSLITALTNYNEGATGPGHCK